MGLLDVLETLLGLLDTLQSLLEYLQTPFQKSLLEQLVGNKLGKGDLQLIIQISLPLFILY